MLHLVTGQALLRLGRLSSAEYLFNRLIQKVSDADCSFGEVAGIPPCSVRLEAIRCGWGGAFTMVGSVAYSMIKIRHFELIIGIILMS